MILSNVKIHEALDSGWLKIVPEPAPRRKTAAGEECPYQTSSVDLRLGNEVSWLKPGIPAQVDLRHGGFAKLFGPNSETKQITEDQPFALEPRRFVLAKTLEWIELPIAAGGPCLAARIEGRSSYARSGLLVHFTAPTIHAGFKGTITLEMINFGPLPILLYPNMFVAQLIIEMVDGVPFDNEGQFQGQSRAGGVVGS
jgi:dCTP deaminase